MAITLLAATTNAGTSVSFSLGSGEEATVYTDALVSGEFADLQEEINDTFQDSYDENGNQIRITGPGSSLHVVGNGAFRVAKTATASACGVYLSK